MKHAIKQDEIDGITLWLQNSSINNFKQRELWVPKIVKGLGGLRLSKVWSGFNNMAKHYLILRNSLVQGQGESIIDGF